MIMKKVKFTGFNNAQEMLTLLTGYIKGAQDALIQLDLNRFEFDMIAYTNLKAFFNFIECTNIPPVIREEIVAKLKDCYDTIIQYNSKKKNDTMNAELEQKYLHVVHYDLTNIMRRLMLSKQRAGLNYPEKFNVSEEDMDEYAINDL